MNDWLPHAVFALGGGLGAMARHALSILVTHRFPLSTLVVNVVGSFALGVAIAYITTQGGGGEWERLAFGFTGGFTTFSSFAYQTLDLHRSETLMHAGTNIVLSLLLCLGAFWAGGAVF